MPRNAMRQSTRTASFFCEEFSGTAAPRASRRLLAECCILNGPSRPWGTTESKCAQGDVQDPMGEERLLPPPTPSGMTLRAFGQRVMRWGTGDAAARARIPTLTREELEQGGLTRDLAETWRDFYRHELLRNPSNPSAAGRAELMQRAVELLPRR